MKDDACRLSSIHLGHDEKFQMQTNFSPVSAGIGLLFEVKKKEREIELSGEFCKLLCFCVAWRFQIESCKCP